MTVKYDEITNRIVNLASSLVQIPSRGDQDSVSKIINFISNWMSNHGLLVNNLYDKKGEMVGVYSVLNSSVQGPILCLNACLDTAPFGDESRWKFPPISGKINKGRLYGRGAADSKIAVSLFANLAIELIEANKIKRGKLYILFDGDEHTGNFGGIKSFLGTVPEPPDAVVVGYPGNYGIVVGARGFLRAKVYTFGITAHSGSKSNKGFNAIIKMANLIRAIYERPLPEENDSDFSFGPKVSVTKIAGGEGFSQIPDMCSCNIDFRLTPNINAKNAIDWLESIFNYIDKEYPSPRATQIETMETWPAYRLPDSHPIVTAFIKAAEKAFLRKLPPVVCGPSNIGNFLTSKGIPTICGFGVTYKNIHASGEYIEIDSIPPVYKTYNDAILTFLEE